MKTTSEISSTPNLDFIQAIDPSLMGVVVRNELDGTVSRLDRIRRFARSAPELGDALIKQAMEGDISTNPRDAYVEGAAMIIALMLQGDTSEGLRTIFDDDVLSVSDMQPAEVVAA